MKQVEIGVLLPVRIYLTEADLNPQGGLKGKTLSGRFLNFRDHNISTPSHGRGNTSPITKRVILQI